jgi:hypothetical protein
MSIAFRRAVTVSQARGCGGAPVTGQAVSAARLASCTASSAICTSPTVRIKVARMRAPSIRIVSASGSLI